MHISKALDPSSNDQRADGKCSKHPHDNTEAAGDGGGSGFSERDFDTQFAVGTQQHTVRIVASAATVPSIVRTYTYVMFHTDLVPGRVGVPASTRHCRGH